MGREVRMVPPNWEHPKDGDRLRPLLPYSYTELRQVWVTNMRLWLDGEQMGRDGEIVSLDPEDMEAGFDDYHGSEPLRKNYMPEWPKEQCTHYQMYENTSEGVPISPPMETPEKLARWLADNRASALGSSSATYEEWLATIGMGWVSSMVADSNGTRSGVEEAGS